MPPRKPIPRKSASKERFRERFIKERKNQINETKRMLLDELNISVKDPKILLEITKQLEKLNLKQKKSYLKFGVSKILKLNPNLEQFKEITKQLDKANSKPK